MKGSTVFLLWDCFGVLAFIFLDSKSMLLTSNNDKNSAVCTMFQLSMPQLHWAVACNCSHQMTNHKTQETMKMLLACITKMC